MSALPFLSAGISLGLFLCALPASAQEAGKKKDAKEAPALDDAAVKLEDEKAPAPAKEAEAEEPAPLALPNMPGLDKLSAEQKTKLAKLLGEAAAFMQGGVRLQETLEKLNAIDEILGENYLTANMRGGVFTKIRDFKAARAEFEKAAALTKEGTSEGFHPRFNLAELEFVQHEWSVARDKFQKLIPLTNDKGTRQLMLYKILICDIKEGKGPGRALDNFDRFDNDSPVWYFAQAVVAFSEKKEEEAEEWLKAAAAIYPKEMNDIYRDSLIECGWLETL